MWASTVGGDALRRREVGMPTNQWHRGDTHPDDITPVAGSAGEQGARNGPDGSTTGNEDGTWGERDVGGLDENEAREELEVLRHNLSQLHKTRTQETHLTQVRSRRSEAAGNLSRRQTKQDEAGDIHCDEKSETEDEFELGQFMREGHFEKRAEDGSEKRVGVIYKNLNVKGVESTSSFVRTVPDAIIGTFGPDLYKILSRYIPALRFGRKPPTRTLINDFTGCVRDGEMMLVLGRPGSGCSTFRQINRSRCTGVKSIITPRMIFILLPSTSGRHSPLPS